MALKFGSVLGGVVSQLGRGDLGPKPSGVVCNWGKGGETASVVFSGLSTHRGVKLLGDVNPSKPGTELQGIVDNVDDNDSGRMHRDLTSFPKPLSVTDITAAPKDGTKVRISYKGVPGAYSEDAALKAYPHCETVPCDEFEDAFKAVELWLADKAVLPIENSLGGSIHRNYDLLLRHRLHIVGEVQLAVNLCLLALPGVRIDQLRRVLSHPQALAQSDIILSNLGVSRENVDDSAGAAQYVALQGLRDAGVVASARAAEIYGLNILAERIQVTHCLAFFSGSVLLLMFLGVIVQKQQLPELVQEVAAARSLMDDSDNITRYLVLARDPIIPRTNKPFKTSIVFTLEEGPGVLFKALAVFALRDINLTKIESRPQRKKPLRVVDDSNTGSPKYFDYLFYIDFEASMAEPRAQTALAHLQEFATFLRVLGCYPTDSFP